YNDLPNKPYDFKYINQSNSTCLNPSLNTLLTTISFHEPKFMDKLFAQNNFRPNTIMKIFLPQASPLDFPLDSVQVAGTVISLLNEWTGTHALLKDIKKYSET